MTPQELKAEVQKWATWHNEEEARREREFYIADGRPDIEVSVIEMAHNVTLDNRLVTFQYDGLVTTGLSVMNDGKIAIWYDLSDDDDQKPNQIKNSVEDYFRDMDATFQRCHNETLEMMKRKSA